MYKTIIPSPSHRLIYTSYSSTRRRLYYGCFSVASNIGLVKDVEARVTVRFPLWVTWSKLRCLIILFKSIYMHSDTFNWPLPSSNRYDQLRRVNRIRNSALMTWIVFAQICCSCLLFGCFDINRCVCHGVGESFKSLLSMYSRYIMRERKRVQKIICFQLKLLYKIFRIKKRSNTKMKISNKMAWLGRLSNWDRSQVTETSEPPTECYDLVTHSLTGLIGYLKKRREK